MMLVFLGPDGCGKSSVIDALSLEISNCFERIEYHHLMLPLPFKREKHTHPTTDPHGVPTYNKVFSILKLFYLLFMYQLGYLFNSHSIHSKRVLILLDRYYQDILVDRRRFRYNGPLFLLNFVSCIIPQPHFFILLDAPTEILQLRKQEVSSAESERQRQAYIAWAKRTPNCCIIDSSQPLEKIVSEINQLIIPRILKNTKKNFRFNDD
jgi:thymidylate kinase